MKPPDRRVTMRVAGGGRKSVLLMHKEFASPQTSHRRTGRLLPLLIATLLLALMPLPAGLAAAPAMGQGPLRIGIDTNTEGNGPLSLSPISSCVSVSVGDTFDVDVFVENVEQLLAWEFYIEFDADVVAIVGRNVEMILASNPGSSVLDVSSPLPNRDGLYRAAAADTSDPPTPDSGSGVLVRLTLEAHSPGLADLELIREDIDGDGLVDLGPLLRDIDGVAMGDTNEDAIFDGPVANARVAVGQPCPDVTPEPSPSPLVNPSHDEHESGSPSVLLVIAIVVGSVAAIGVGGFAVFRLLGGLRRAAG